MDLALPTTPVASTHAASALVAATTTCPTHIPSSPFITANENVNLSNTAKSSPAKPRTPVSGARARATPLRHSVELHQLTQRLVQLEEQNKTLQAQLKEKDALLEKKNAVLKQITELDQQKRSELAATVHALSRAGSSPSIRQFTGYKPLTLSLTSFISPRTVKYELAVTCNGIAPYRLPNLGYSDFRSFRQLLIQAAHADARPHLSLMPFCSDTDAIEVQTLTRLSSLRFPPKLLLGNLNDQVVEVRRADLETYLREVVQICRLASRGSSVRKLVSRWIEIPPEVDEIAWRSSLPAVRG